MRWSWKRTVLLALWTACAVDSEVPATFKSGDPIRSSEVNANFHALDTGLANAVARWSAQITKLSDQIQAIQAKVSQDSAALADQKVKAKADSVALAGKQASVGSVPVGTVIASFKRPDESGTFMDGDTTWALANGKIPAGVPYKGAFPDLRGQFLRGMNEGRTDSLKDPEVARSVGGSQGDAFQGHVHPVLVSGLNLQKDGPISGQALNVQTVGQQQPVTLEGNGDSKHRTSGYEADGAMGGPRISSESRPKNVSVYWYVKVR